MSTGSEFVGDELTATNIKGVGTDNQILNLVLD